ncbi:MAG: hypothetical protein J5707_01350, partial [Candidatus Methanomethylophilus sp.]|nr:hypothetical protein [Methanomethylophilus sp.]
TYSLQKDAAFSYYFVITDSKGTKMFYSDVYDSSVDTADFTAQIELKDKKTLKGYVGSSVDGDILMTFDTTKKALVTVSGGEYSADLPVGDGTVTVSAMQLTASKDYANYTYSITAIDLLGGTPLTVDGDKAQNFAVSTVKAAAGDITLSAGTMNCGSGEGDVTVSIKGGDGTYFVDGGSGFTLDQTYTKTIYADELHPVDTIVVHGYFSAAAIGAGNSNMTVTVTKLGDSDSTTLVVPETFYTGGATGSVTVTTAADGDAKDSLNGFGYKYVMAFKNENSAAKQIIFDKAHCVIGGTDADKWTLAFVDESGYLVDAATYYIDGLTTTNLYAMLIDTNGAGLAVPSLTVKFSGGDYTSDIDFAGPQTGSMSVDSSSASGSGVENSEATVPFGFWILVVFVVLIFLLSLWGGMKRGVFSRRN